MNDLTFKIRKISSGRFDVSFILNKEKLNICASNAWGNNAPKRFLELLCRLVKKQTESGYIAFDDEPGTLVICIYKGEQSNISIAYSELDDDEWKKMPLYGDLEREEIYRQIPIERELLAVSDVDFDKFVRSVIAEFDRYAPKHKRDKYEGNWMPFPMEDLRLLKIAARQEG